MKKRTANPSAFTKSIFCDRLLAKLYTRTQGSQVTILNKLILDNSKLHGNNKSTIYWSNKFFFMPQMKFVNTKAHPTNVNARANSVHPELRERMRKYITANEKIRREREQIKSFIQSIFLITQNKTDWREILPEALNGIVDNTIKAYDVNFQHPPIASDILSAFKLKNNKYIEIMKSRLLYNLIDMG